MSTSTPRSGSVAAAPTAFTSVGVHNSVRLTIGLPLLVLGLIVLVAGLIKAAFLAIVPGILLLLAGLWIITLRATLRVSAEYLRLSVGGFFRKQVPLSAVASVRSEAAPGRYGVGLRHLGSGSWGYLSSGPIAAFSLHDGTEIWVSTPQPERIRRIVTAAL